MKFNGNIIITDPCYIMKKPDYSKMPKYEDFFSYLRKEIDDDGKENTYYDILAYQDVRDETLEEYLAPYKNDAIFNSQMIEWLTKDYYNLKENGNLSKVSSIFQKEEAAYNAAFDKWYEENEGDWDKTNCGEDFSPLGFTNFLSSYNGYGDWSCTTVNKDTNEKIGKFCADAGMVGVFLLDEVLRYNPDFDYHINRPWTTTLIKNFNGDIELVKDKENNISVVGKGNINFFTIQTGF